MAERSPAADWRSAVGIRPAEDLRAELDRRRETAALRRSIWVTDLLDLRTAYYQRVAPVPMSPERRQRADVGRRLHSAIGARLAPAENLEVRVQREGIVGQIDLLQERPTELKTTGTLPDPSGLVDARPQYAEQLAMYCALLGRPEGRLLLVETSDGRAGRAVVLDLTFHDLDRAFEEMLRRADQLRAAWDRRSPEGLPACEWRGRGCPFETANVCDCTGSEAPPTRSLAALVESAEFRPVESDEITRDLARAPPEPPAARRFRDLLYPRRAYFEAVSPRPPEEAEETVERPIRDDLYRQVLDLLEAGAPGEVTRVPTKSGVPQESVPCFRGDPYLLKVSRAWQRTPASDLLARQPQYFLDLGFRCASIGRPEGWLLVAYERAERWPDRLEAFRVRFDPLGALDRLAHERVSSLADAVRRRDPSGLPPCPEWMFERCDYRDVCGCAAPSRE